MCFFVSSSILAEVQWKQTDWVRVKQKKKNRKRWRFDRGTRRREWMDVGFESIADLIKGGQKIPVRMLYVE
jgi:hypothetical protein